MCNEGTRIISIWHPEEWVEVCFSHSIIIVIVLTCWRMARGISTRQRSIVIVILLLLLHLAGLAPSGSSALLLLLLVLHLGRVRWALRGSHRRALGSRHGRVIVRLRGDRVRVDLSEGLCKR